MPLRKPPTLTPALLASNRRNAKRSTGPRAPQGKAWSRLNRLRHGARSPEYINFLEALIDAPPGRMIVTSQAILLSKQVFHPLFVEAAMVSVQAEIDICEEQRWRRAQGK